MPANIDFEASLYCQLGKLGFRSDMIDLGRKGCTEPRIFCRTKAQHE